MMREIPDVKTIILQVLLSFAGPIWQLGFSSIRLRSPTIISSLSYLRSRGLGVSDTMLDHKEWRRLLEQEGERRGVSFEGPSTKWSINARLSRTRCTLTFKRIRIIKQIAGPYVGPWGCMCFRPIRPFSHLLTLYISLMAVHSLFQAYCTSRTTFQCHLRSLLRFCSYSLS